jgi:hypothetical protein
MKSLNVSSSARLWKNLLLLMAVDGFESSLSGAEFGVSVWFVEEDGPWTPAT